MVRALDGQEWTRYYRIRAVTGISALHARFVTHRYPRHAHEYWVVGLVDAGVQSYFYRGSRHVTTAGRIFVVNPGEAHTGEPASPAGYVYRTLCLDQGFVASVLGELAGVRNQAVYFRGAVFDDPALGRSLSEFHRALESGVSSLEQESHLLQALALLFTRYADAPGSAPAVGREPRAVEEACGYIETHFDEDVSLADLARFVRLSPWYLARVFERSTGLPPHAYLEGVRIRKACEFLDQGRTIVEAALSAGYADQSHLTKRFRRFLGITPRQYLRDRQPLCRPTALRGTRTS